MSPILHVIVTLGFAVLLAPIACVIKRLFIWNLKPTWWCPLCRIERWIFGEDL